MVHMDLFFSNSNFIIMHLLVGMLLELDVATLQQLLDSPSMLDVKAKIAYEIVAHRAS